MKNTNKLTMKILRAGVTLLGTKLEKRLHFVDKSWVYDFTLDGIIYTFYPRMKFILGGGGDIMVDVSNKQQFVHFISQHL